jgi:Lipoprotein confined to pathogenic Mycobacterium
VLLGIALLLTACVKTNTFDPYATPGRNELDRLQKIVNERRDLEIIEQQLATLDSAIDAAIAKYSPRTHFSATEVSQSTNGCNNTFNRSIGRQEKSDDYFGQPAPTPDQWQHIVAELAPPFGAAGFKTEVEYAGTQGVPLPPGSQNDSQLRDDGVGINLVGGSDRGPMNYSYDTGCHLPAAWRSAPPPPNMRPSNDPNVHYPYLYGSPGGRTGEAFG